MANFSDSNMPPWYSFADRITAVSVGEGITSIGELAFYDCESLSNVILPNTLREIGIRAFKDCTSLSYLNLPSSLYVIAESAFENCSKLNGIRLTEGMTILGDKAFFRCSSLTSITVPASIEYFGMVVFAYCENLIRADIRCRIQKLPDWTFYGCQSLLSVALPDCLNAVGARSFHDCDQLTDIHYEGEKSSEIYEMILDDNNTITSHGGMTHEEIKPSVGGVREVVSEDGLTGTTVLTGVSDTENAIISLEETVEFAISPDGKKNENTVIGVSVTALVETEEGWEELSETIKSVVPEGTASEQGITVEIQTTDTTVSGEWLDSFAGNDIVMVLTTPEGASWQVNLKDSEQGQINPSKEYDLAYRLTTVEEPVQGIESQEVYQLTFSDTIDFNIQVRGALGVGNQNRTATLYQKVNRKVTAVQSSLIDNEGRAWFSLANADQKTEYYVAIDAEGISKDQVIIPKTMAKEYSGLIDMNGVRYEITGRSSKWGITAGQYALYAGIVIGGMILIVSVIMIVRNHMVKLKAEKQRLKRKQEDEIDRDALYEEVLHDLLEEQKRKQSSER
ncbi:MAG: leucine-rich repeat domain-containing protein [Lachnospiraceae bacterium]|nr:leucine-rich repeat domain-containing protein [Lachnospiraceae bacterium]